MRLSCYYTRNGFFAQEKDSAAARRTLPTMNVYDFDNTILRGDSTARFFAHCLFRTPRMWLDAPAQIANALLFAARLRDKQAFKERLFRVFTHVPDIDRALARFWEKNFRRVKPFYLERRGADEVVISASPEFLIRPACDALGIRHVMGSPVDKHTGRYFGKNCHGAEKVVRFRAAFPDGQIDEFYSDSYSDQPLADIARRAFFVKGDRVLSWRAKN